MTNMQILYTGGNDELNFLYYNAYFMFFLSFITFFCLHYFDLASKTYGRYSESSFFKNYQLNGTLAWFLQEIPCVIMGAISLSYSYNQSNRLLVALFMLHYIHRSIIFPFKLRGGKKTPLLIFFLAMVFCFWNGYLQTRYHTYFYQIDDHYFRHYFGFIIFITGMFINIQSDNILIQLRKKTNDQSYHIPNGGLYEYLSCPNFFGESLEWFGYALYANSIPSYAFFVYTISNLLPRAISHHIWYHKKFGKKYPSKRKAMIPFLL